MHVAFELARPSFTYLHVCKTHFLIHNAIYNSSMKCGSARQRIYRQAWRVRSKHYPLTRGHAFLHERLTVVDDHICVLDIIVINGNRVPRV